MMSSLVSQEKSATSPRLPAGTQATFAHDEDRRKAERLGEYARAKLALANWIRRLRETLKSRGSRDRADRCDGLLTKLAEDRFTLAVLGRFNRGKSTLMNAIIGREILPTGLVPLTSVITVVRFGPEERLLLRRAGWTTLHQVSVDRLADYVTERGNPGNREEIEAAYLELPLPFLRYGLEFVDTPGVGSAIEANTATTLRYLGECDAAVFVTSVDSALSEDELTFLRRVREHAHKVFFVVNKTDIVEPGGLAAVLAFTNRVLQETVGDREMRIFPVSARSGLLGRSRNDAATYSESGIGALEAALTDYLAAGKATTFLASVSDKARCIVRAETRDGRLRQRLGVGDERARRDRVKMLRHKLGENAETRAKLVRRLRGEFVVEAKRGLRADFDAWCQRERAALPRKVGRLMDCLAWLPAGLAVRRIGKAVSRLSAEAARRQLSALFAEIARAQPHLRLPGARALADNLEAIHHALDDVASGPEGGPSESGTDILPAWRETAGKPGPTGDPWRVVAPHGVAWFPVCFVRRRIGRELVAETVSRLSLLRSDCLSWAEDRLGADFDRWVSELEEAAERREAPILAVVDGQELPGLADSDADLEAIETGLDHLNAEFASGRFAEEGDSGSEIDRPGAPRKPPVGRAAEVPVDLPRALETRGCPACDDQVQVGLAYFSGLQYALCYDAGAQTEFARDLGLCPTHLWQLEAVSSPTGTSVGHAPLVERVARMLRRAVENPSMLAEVPSGPASCRVCELQVDGEKIFLAALGRFVREAAGRAAYLQSQGLCLHHLRVFLRQDGLDTDTARFMLEQAARRFEALAEDMRTYGLKTEALRRELRNRDEDDAYLRALTLLAGSRRICRPWKSDPVL